MEFFCLTINENRSFLSMKDVDIVQDIIISHPDVCRLENPVIHVGSESTLTAALMCLLRDMKCKTLLEFGCKYIFVRGNERQEL